VGIWPLGRRRNSPEPSAPAPRAGAPRRLAVVELWTAERRLTVGLELGGARLTDVLNGEPMVSVVVLDPPPEEGSVDVELRPEHAWQDLNMEAILLAFPPPQATDPRRRLHRPRQLIELQVGPFEVSGTVHIPPGAQAAGFLARQGRRFEPVTRVSVRDSRSELFERRADVVLANLHGVQTMRDVGLAEGTEIDLAEGETAGQ